MDRGQPRTVLLALVVTEGGLSSAARLCGRPLPGGLAPDSHQRPRVTVEAKRARGTHLHALRRLVAGGLGDLLQLLKGAEHG